MKSPMMRRNILKGWNILVGQKQIQENMHLMMTTVHYLRRKLLMVLNYLRQKLLMVLNGVDIAIQNIVSSLV